MSANQILSEMPVLTGDMYAPVMPAWFTYLIRGFLLILGLGAAWIGIHEWNSMPLLVKILIGVFAPALLLSATQVGAWGRFTKIPFLIAGPKGMCFKHILANTKHVGSGSDALNLDRNNWLFVPWENISNFRMESFRIGTTLTTGVVTDIKSTPDQLKPFLRAVSQPDNADFVSVAIYVNTPPSPREVMKELQKMMDQYKKSPMREKYERVV